MNELTETILAKKTLFKRITADVLKKYKVVSNEIALEEIFI